MSRCHRGTRAAVAVVLLITIICGAPRTFLCTWTPKKIQTSLPFIGSRSTRGSLHLKAQLRTPNSDGLGRGVNYAASMLLVGSVSLFGLRPSLLSHRLYPIFTSTYRTTASSSTPVSDAEQITESKEVTSVPEPFLNPAWWNKLLVRSFALIVGGMTAGRFVPFVGAVHLFAYGTWLGTSLWTTFVAGITMFKHLPRKQFGMLQAQLFPKYFQLGTICTCVVLLTSVRMGMQPWPLLISLLCTLANLLYLEPKATNVMFQRYALDGQDSDPEVRKDLKKQFGKLHGMSSLANLVGLVSLVIHGCAIAARL